MPPTQTPTASVRNLIRFAGFDGHVRFSHYIDNGRLALWLEAADTPTNRAREIEPGEELTVITCNIPKAHLDPFEVVIKDWSENAGIIEALAPLALLHPTGRTLPTGFVRAPVFSLDREVMRQLLQA